MDKEDWSALRTAHKWLWAALVAIAWGVGLSTGMGVFSPGVNLFNCLAVVVLAITLYTLGKPLKDKDKL